MTVCGRGLLDPCLLCPHWHRLVRPPGAAAHAMLHNHKLKLPVVPLAVAFTVGFCFHLSKMGWQILLPGSLPGEAADSIWIYWLGIWLIVGLEFVHHRIRGVSLRANLIAITLIGLSVAMLAVTLLLPSLEQVRLYLASQTDSLVWINLATTGLTGAIFLVPGFLMGVIIALGIDFSRALLTPFSRAWFLTSGFLGYSLATILGWLLMAHLSVSQACMAGSLLPAAVGLTLAGRTSGTTSESERSRRNPEDEQRSIFPVALFVLTLTYMMTSLLWLKVHFYIGSSTISTHWIGIASVSSGMTIGACISLLKRSWTKTSVGIAALLTAILLAWLGSYWQMVRTFYQHTTPPDLLADVKAGLLLGLIPAISAGFMLTVAITHVTRSREPMSLAGRRIGIVLAGMLTAALVTSYLPNHYLTFEVLLRWLPFACLGAGVVWMGQDVRRPGWLVSVAVLAVLAVVLMLSQSPWQKPLLAGLVASAKQPESFDILYYQESPKSVTAVTRTPYEISIWAGGNRYASMPEDFTGEALSGHIALIMHPDPQRILIVGLSTGTLLNAIETHPVKLITLIVPQPDLRSASTYLKFYNRSPFQDSRLKVLEGRFSDILPGMNTFDVVIIDRLPPLLPFGKSQPTAELIELARRTVSRDGLVVERVDLRNVSPDIFKATIATFAPQFPSVELWLAGGFELVMVGSNQLLSVDPQVIANRIVKRAVGDDLGRLGIMDPAGLLSCYLMGKAGIHDLVATSPRLSKNNAIKQAALSKSRRWYPRIIADLEKTSGDPMDIVAGSEQGRSRLGENISNCHKALRSFMRALQLMYEGRDHEATALTEQAIEVCSSNGILRHFLSDYYSRIAHRLESRGRVEESVRVARRAVEMNENNHVALYQWARVEPDRALGRNLVTRAIEINPYYVPAYLYRAEIEITTGKPEDALKTISKLLNVEPFNEQAAYLRALALIRTNALEDAQRILEDIKSRSPGYTEAIEALAYTLTIQGRLTEARTLYEELYRSHPDNVAILNNYATVLAEQGDYEDAVEIWQRALRIDPDNSGIRANIEEARSKLRSQ